MYGKPLAYIVKIKEIHEIPGADRIELAKVMDYTVVVKKGEYVPGDLAMYVEIDSLLPDGLSDDMRAKYNSIKDGSYFNGVQVSSEEVSSSLIAIQKSSKYPYFEFLRDRKFKIKSMKLSKFGVISQGILFRPQDIGLTSVKLGEDYTGHFGITEIVQDMEEAGLKSSSGKQDGWLVRKLMRFGWFRSWRKRHQVSETWNSSFPSPSDEENVQKIFSAMKEKYGDRTWVATEKLEGQNITVYTEYHKGLFGRKKIVGVCSRTRRLNKNGTGSTFWATVLRLKLDKKIKDIEGEWFCRGEHVGPKIQKNIYKLGCTDIVFFDFYKKVEGSWKKLDYAESVKFAYDHGLKFVPVVDDNFKLPNGYTNNKGIEIDGCQELLEYSDGPTVFGNDLKHKREGIVLRLKDDYTVSFKVKNPNYTL